MEYLNLYDKAGNLTNEKGIRGEKTDKLVGIALIFIENSKGEFLIQKTSPSRESVYATTGGHVSYGRTFEETIINEVKEELGIDITNDKIIEMNTYIRERVIQKVFYLKKDINISEITIQEDEVEFIEWLTKEEINEIIKNKEFRPSNLEPYKYVLEHKK